MTDTKSEPNYQDILDKYANSIKSTEIPTPPQPEPELQSTQEPEALLETELTPESKLEINSQSTQEPEALLETELTPESKIEINPTEENKISENSESISEAETPIIPEVPTETNFETETPILTAPPVPEAINSSEAPIEIAPESSDIIPPKENHFFKYLFFFSLFIFIIVLITIISTFIHSQQSLNSTAAPTAAVLPTDVPKTSCDINGQQYTVGETFVATDGCNKCSCNADLTIVCTEMACESTPSVKLSPTKSAITLAIPASWKTYTISTYGISFKYPQEYFKYVNEYQSSIYFAPTEGKGAEIGTPMALTSGDVWFTVNISPAKSGQKSTPKELISSNGPQPGSSFQSVIVENGNAIKIVLSSFSKDTLSKFESTFNQILSTFKFN